MHDQRPPAGSDRPLRDYVLAGTADLAAVEEELRALERAMAAGEHDARTLRRYSEAQARLEHAGGYDWRDRAAAVVRGLGFTTEDLDRPLSSFSGGELTRASLARALAAQPDLLLLDEPTNHLDIESLEWLEGMLRTIDAAVILVAHDRWFLEAVTTAVLELEGGRSTFFPGEWHVWRREQAARAIHAAKTAERQAEELERLERFVERFGAKNTKAKQAQSKVKQIARIKAQQVEAGGPAAPAHARVRVPEAEAVRVASCSRSQNVDLAAGEKQLLRGVDFALERGEHVALVGPNGAGKTTLLETILGRRDPVSGRISVGHGVEVAYFSQHEVELDERGSVLDAAVGATGLRRPEAQALLGRFLFSGWETHEKPVTALSGGERRRLALALVVASGANFLVLDEPTNHLDVESREALEAALEAFPGTVLLVSHDRALLDAFADRTLAIEHGRLASYPGWLGRVRPSPRPARRCRAAVAAPKARKGAQAEAGPGTQGGTDPARARRARDRPRRGAGRRARAPPGRGLDRHRPPGRPPRRPRRPGRPARPLGGALRGLIPSARPPGPNARRPRPAQTCCKVGTPALQWTPCGPANLGSLPEGGWGLGMGQRGGEAQPLLVGRRSRGLQRPPVLQRSSGASVSPWPSSWEW